MHFLVIGKNDSGEFRLCYLFRQTPFLLELMERLNEKSQVSSWVDTNRTGIQIVYPEDEASKVPFLRPDDVKKIKQDVEGSLRKGWMTLGEIELQPLSEERQEVTLTIQNDEETYTYVYQVGARGVRPVAYREIIMKMGLIAVQKALRETAYFLAVTIPLACCASLLLRRRHKVYVS